LGVSPGYPIIKKYDIMRKEQSTYLKTEIAKDIETAGYQIQYDAQCKKVLAHKQILAWIMKETVMEFSHLSIKEIYHCIEQEPQISTMYLEPGLTHAKEKITGINTEDNIQNEGFITYDIRFEAFAPQRDTPIKIILNIEAQKNFYPGYPIVTRGIYYDARMISSQNGTEFSKSNYGDIKKVYSIWICMNAPKHIGNAISRYDIHKTDMIHSVPDNIKNYDKMCVVIICLNETQKENYAFFNLLNTLLSPTLNIKLKKEILQNEYQIPMDDGLNKELNLMCNLSEYVWECGNKAGLKEGTNTVVKNLLKIGSIPESVIMEAAQITEEELRNIKNNM